MAEFNSSSYSIFNNSNFLFSSSIASCAFLRAAKICSEVSSFTFWISSILFCLASRMVMFIESISPSALRFASCIIALASSFAVLISASIFLRASFSSFANSVFLLLDVSRALRISSLISFLATSSFRCSAFISLRILSFSLANSSFRAINSGSEELTGVDLDDDILSPEAVSSVVLSTDA